jgi:protein-S-isoprenylcysteine O-methyltransferase Ste14
MDLYNKKDKSIAQKVTLIALEVLILGISYWILFLNGYNRIFSSSDPVDGNPTRHLILFIFNVVVFIRILITVFYLLKRRMPWEETFSIAFAFALYYAGFALLGYRSGLNIGIVDIVAIAIFLFGSFLNTGSELARDRWKRNPDNKGHLYTAGLFKYSMHINYFGDLLWVSGYALLTRNRYSIAIPVLLFCFFAYYNIPKLDAYLALKYGEQFGEYRKRTKKFIPFIY